MGIQGRATLMAMDLRPGDPLHESLRGIEEHVKTAAGLTRQLLGLARGGKYEVKPQDLNEIIEKSADMFGRTRKEIRIHKRLQEDIWTVGADRSQMEQVLLNLLVNAWQAMSGSGGLFLETRNVDLDGRFVAPFGVAPGRFVKVAVTDTGIGMDEETQKRVFDPFFSTKEMGRGTGLGLASVYGIVKNHGGFITVESRPGEGATFSINFPASTKATVREAPKVPALLKGSETILLVDDEEMVLDVGEAMLIRLGYKVLRADEGREALNIYEKHREAIDLVILDLIMPGMGGEAVCKGLWRMNPEVRVLLSSGYSIDDQAGALLEKGCSGFIQKPFGLEALSQKLREILNDKKEDSALRRPAETP